jgi:hypothetical protein
VLKLFCEDSSVILDKASPCKDFPGISSFPGVFRYSSSSLPGQVDRLSEGHKILTHKAMKLQDTFTAIDFEKDFANHMRELASEITGLHTNGLTYEDDLETLNTFAGFDSKWGVYEPEERE